MAIALVVLAAGQGTRMNSDLPKVLHPLGGAPLLAHALQAGAALEPERTIVITGHGAEAVERAGRALDNDAVFILQDEQLGTGHAVRMAEAELADFDGDVLVLYGDTPFVRSVTLAAMRDRRDAGADLVVLGFDAADPGRYGRLIAEHDRLEKIVEAKDATDEELSVTLCNSGLLMASSKVLFDLLGQVDNENVSEEYYLTDVIGLARNAGLDARVVRCDEDETLGINTRAELAKAEAAFQSRARTQAMEDGVTLADPATTYFSLDTAIGRDTQVGPNVVFGPGVTVESGAEIRAFSHLAGCHVSSGAIVGPFARLRPGAELAEAARVGNFVEVKNATIDAGAKVNHLSYVGDAHIGEAANIGAGTITCNYDGVFKHRTEIGARAFIGSNTMLVAPVRVGDEAMTASGSVITSDVPDGDLAVARGTQSNKPGLARRLMNRLRALKARENG